jgi:hypothetical protein
MGLIVFREGGRKKKEKKIQWTIRGTPTRCGGEKEK